MRVELVLQNWPLFARGVWITLELTVIALAVGFAIALPAGMARARRVPWVSPLNSGAYGTEIVRGAVETTPGGILEAAQALGLSPRQVDALVLIPSALRRALPQYGNEVVFMLHGSAVASVITLQDILGAGRTLNAKYYLAYEGFLTAALLYMAITFVIVGVFRLLERRYLRHIAVMR